MGFLSDLLASLLRRRKAPPPVVPPVGPGVTDEELADAVYAAHLDARDRAGRPGLSRDTRLERAAQVHAADMAARGRMSHSGSDGSDVAARVARVNYRWSRLGENVAGSFPSVESVMSAWLSSPGHRANILGGYNSMGVGVARSKAWAPYWCCVFSSPAIPSIGMAPMDGDEPVSLPGPIEPTGE